MTAKPKRPDQHGGVEGIKRGQTDKGSCCIQAYVAYGRGLMSLATGLLVTTLPDLRACSIAANTIF